MATAFQEVRMGVGRLGLANPPLSSVERAALEHCEKAAACGDPVTQMSVMQAIGSQNTTGGTSAGVLGRLEAKGYIERHVYQRGVKVCIVATGQCTAEPECTVPHWRTLKDRAPVPAIHQIRQRDMSLAQWVETEARRTNRDCLDFLQELVRRGCQDYRADQEQGEC